MVIQLTVLFYFLPSHLVRSSSVTSDHDALSNTAGELAKAVTTVLHRYVIWGHFSFDALEILALYTIYFPTNANHTFEYSLCRLVAFQLQEFQI